MESGTLQRNRMEKATTSAVLTIREIAAILKLADKTVYAMATAGELPAFKVRGQWRVRQGDFDSWLRQKAAERPGGSGNSK